jgi:carbonic anhydrase
MKNPSHGYDRAAFLKGASLLSAGSVAAALGLGQSADAAGGGPPMEAHTPVEALAKLKAGNERFAAGKPQCAPLTARVAELASGQNPFAIVLGCSDSRVPVETIFDQVPGNIFVVRVAGNFLTNEGLGSIEYAVDHLHSKLILVLGHSSCGAVSAAVAYLKSGTAQLGHIQDLVTAIEPAARVAKSAHGDWLTNAIAENVKRNVTAMAQRSSIIHEAVSAGHLQVAGAVYDLHTGRVAF